MRLPETEYWNIVMRVMQGSFLPLHQVHTSEDMTLEDHSVTFGESGFTDGQNSIGSSAAPVRESDGGIKDVAGHH